MFTHEQALSMCTTDPHAAAELIVELSRRIASIEDRQRLLERENQRLRERVRELERRLATNSRYKRTLY